jgi:hypothetical protein
MWGTRHTAKGKAYRACNKARRGEIGGPSVDGCKLHDGRGWCGFVGVAGVAQGDLDHEDGQER